MLCATVNGPSFADAKKQVLDSLPFVDIIELRTDALFSLSDEEIRTLMALARRTMLTVKKYHDLPDHMWIQRTLDLAKLRPTYLDIEYTFPRHALAYIQQHYPTIKIQLSFHGEGEDDLSALYQRMCAIPADAYKIAVTSTNSIDTLRCMQMKYSLPKNTTVLCMGDAGIPSRILSPIIDNHINYVAAVGALPSAPGQMSLSDLLNYNYTQLHSSSSIYGLIGNPIHYSISHLSHNQAFAQLAIPSSYIKMPLQPCELPHFLSLARQLPFKGISVTRPFKTQILNHIDSMDDSVTRSQSCNTLVFQDHTITGYNTDGLGVIRLFQRKGISIKNAHIAIIGSGGAARAIAYECAYRGAHMSIFSRNEREGNSLATLCSGTFSPLSPRIKGHFDITILCTPPHVDLPTISTSVLLDINTLPQKSSYTEQARQRGCSILYGYEMFAQQALLQFSLWFPHKIPSIFCETFTKNIENILYPSR